MLVFLGLALLSFLLWGLFAPHRVGNKSLRYDSHDELPNRDYLEQDDATFNQGLQKDLNQYIAKNDEKRSSEEIRWKIQGRKLFLNENLRRTAEMREVTTGSVLVGLAKVDQFLGHTQAASTHLSRGKKRRLRTAREYLTRALKEQIPDWYFAVPIGQRDLTTPETIINAFLDGDTMCHLSAEKQKKAHELIVEVHKAFTEFDDACYENNSFKKRAYEFDRFLEKNRLLIDIIFH